MTRTSLKISCSFDYVKLERIDVISDQHTHQATSTLYDTTRQYQQYAPTTTDHNFSLDEYVGVSDVFLFYEKKRQPHTRQDMTLMVFFQRGITKKIAQEGRIRAPANWRTSSQETQSEKSRCI